MFETLKLEMELLGYSKETMESYLYYNRNFIEFIKKQPKYITSNDIKKYLIHNLNKKPRTINLIISALKFYYERIYHKKLFHYIKRMKQPKTIPEILSKEEVKKMFLESKNLKHKILIGLLYGSGLRVGECTRLKIEDLNLDEKYGKIRKGKGNKDRLIILSEQTCSDIRNYLRKRNKESEYLFETKKGHYSNRTAQEIIKQTANNIGIKRRIYPHIMRSSFATHLIDNNTQIEDIQKLMGHADKKTTEGYIKSSVKNINSIKSPLDK